MSKISNSPDRYTFQKQSYLKNIVEKGDSVDPQMLKVFDDIITNHACKFNDAELCKDNMEYDLVTTDWILAKARANNVYAQNIYSAICNNDFQKLDVIPILKQQTWSASWRSAGGIVADMLQKGDYLDWYCSGIGGGFGDEDSIKGYVGEGCVTDEIRHDLQQLGWVLVPGGDWEKF